MLVVDSESPVETAKVEFSPLDDKKYVGALLFIFMSLVFSLLVLLLHSVFSFTGFFNVAR